jgi:hypothetical protein
MFSKLGVFQTIYLSIARQPAKLPNTKFRKAAFLRSQPATTQINKP